jgi:hypothetical protein
MPYKDPTSDRALQMHRDRQRRYEAAHPASYRRWRSAHREELRATASASYAAHIEQRRAAALVAAHRRREMSLAWGRPAPWPTACVICGGAFEGSFPNPKAETLGHEPPLSWVRKHPEYSGPFMVRPEHWACNRRKWRHPDWELAA